MPHLMRSMIDAASLRACSAEISPCRPMVTRFRPLGPRVCTTYDLRPVRCTRTPKPGSSRSQKTASLLSTRSPSTLRLEMLSWLLFGMAPSHGSGFVSKMRIQCVIKAHTTAIASGLIEANPSLRCKWFLMAIRGIIGITSIRYRTTACPAAFVTCQTIVTQSASRSGVRSARSGPKSVSGNTVEARDAAGGRLGATRRAALSGRQGSSRRLPDVPASRCAPFLPCRPDSAAQTMTLVRIPGWPGPCLRVKANRPIEERPWLHRPSREDPDHV